MADAIELPLSQTPPCAIDATGPQVHLPDTTQRCVIFGGTSGWRRNRSAYLSQVKGMPRVLRRSHFRRLRCTPR